MKKSRSKGRNPESGYALLLIFAMAAIVAIGLYMQLPRVAFEAQRDKEQLLIDHGEQYSRAIQLFVHKFNRYPATMEELENTNNVRTLRRRYVDPMTGKSDWRILHAGPGGVLLDSVTTVKKPDATAQQTFITELPFGGNLPSGDAGINLANRLRPSDQPGAPGNLNGNPNAIMPDDSGLPVSNMPTSGPVMVLPDGRIVPATATGIPAAAPGANPGANPLMPPGLVSANGSLLPGGMAVQQPNTPPLPNQVGTPNNAAVGMINQILTTPRPGGFNGLQGGQTVDAQGNPVPTAPTAPGVVVGVPARPAGGAAATPQQQVIGAGLAGVASKREQEGIKEYNKRTAYNEWEFVYDPTKDPARRGVAGATGAQGATGAAVIPPVPSPTAPMTRVPGR